MTQPMPSTMVHLDSLVAVADAGWLVISTATETGSGWRSRHFTTNEVDIAARWCAQADAAGLNVYVRTNLLARPLDHAGERGTTADTGAAVALVVDLDVAGPGHKQGATAHPLPPDLAAAMSVVDELPPPSLTIDTGGGAHLWWLLDKAEYEAPVALLETWAGRIVEAGARKGWHVDRPDPARVLRVCGTHRRKPGIAPNHVALVDVAGWPTDGLASRPWCPAGRYDARKLIEVLPAPTRPPAPPAPARHRRRDGEVYPSDAMADLSWAEVLEPFGWTFAGTGSISGMPVELWRRPGDPTSAYSAKATADVLIVHSEAAGFPKAGGAGYSKLQALAHLGFGGSVANAGRAIWLASRAVTR